MKINSRKLDTAGKPAESPSKPSDLVALVTGKPNPKDDEGDDAGEDGELEVQGPSMEEPDETEDPVPGSLMPMLNDDEVNEAWEAIDKLELQGVMSRSRFAARERFARLMAVKITPEFLGVNLLEVAELLQECIRGANAMVKSKASVKSKLLAIEQVTQASKAQAELSKQIIKLFKPKRSNDEQPIYVPVAANSIAPNSDGPLILATNVQINQSRDAKTGSLPPTD